MNLMSRFKLKKVEVSIFYMGIHNSTLGTEHLRIVVYMYTIYKYIIWTLYIRVT